MVGTNDIVITGLGCVSPIGIGRQEFWRGLHSGTCGIGPIHRSQSGSKQIYYGGVIPNFDGKVYVTPRKALKVMNREVQTAYSAAHLAWQDAGLATVELDADRLGVIYGAEMFPGDITDVFQAVKNCCEDGVAHVERWGEQFSKDIFPLWMLKNLPNMPACHVGIAINARGPNNTIVQEEISGLQSLIEACMIMERDQADVMMVGAVGGRLGPVRLAFRHPAHYRVSDGVEAERMCVPFDAKRAGIVPGEAAAAIVLERRSHAVKRGATILAEIKGFANRFAKPEAYAGGSRVAIGNAIQAALNAAEIEPTELAMIAAQGFSSPCLDIEESLAIEKLCGQVPVVAFSSYFGTTGASCGLVEMIAGMLATGHQTLLPTLGYAHPDPDCPIHVTTKIERTPRDYMLKLSFTPYGHATAAVLRCNSLIS